MAAARTTTPCRARPRQVTAPEGHHPALRCTTKPAHTASMPLRAKPPHPSRAGPPRRASLSPPHITPKTLQLLLFKDLQNGSLARALFSSKIPKIRKTQNSPSSPPSSVEPRLPLAGNHPASQCGIPLACLHETSPSLLPRACTKALLVPLPVAFIVVRSIVRFRVKSTQRPETSGQRQGRTPKFVERAYLKKKIFSLPVWYRIFFGSVVRTKVSTACRCPCTTPTD